VLTDYASAPIELNLKSMLAYLEKLTLTPEDVGPDDVVPLRAVGLSDEAIADAVHVCAMFNIYDRLADALGWEVPANPEFWPKQSKFLLKSGYEGGKHPTSTE
jgi:alkylhydroperoxidase family enzyme